MNKRSEPEDSGFPPSWKCGVLVQSCSQSARNKDRHHTGEPETNMSLREEMSQRAEMWREKASRQHNHTFSRGGLTLGGLSICLSATLLWLQDDEGALVQVYAQSSLNNHTELIIDGSAYQTVSKLHLHLARPRQQPERPYTHTHTESWTRQPLHWPWPMNSRVLFHLLRQHSCCRGCLAGSRLFCISAR